MLAAISMVFMFSDIDECLSKPCMHGAACVDGANSYICMCINGYGGHDCETGMIQLQG